MNVGIILDGHFIGIVMMNIGIIPKDIYIYVYGPFTGITIGIHSSRSL